MDKEVLAALDAGMLLLAILVGGFVVYLLVRIGSAAYFRSKEDHEQRKQNHGKRIPGP